MSSLQRSRDISSSPSQMTSGARKISESSFINYIIDDTYRSWDPVRAFVNYQGNFPVERSCAGRKLAKDGKSFANSTETESNRPSSSLEADDEQQSLGTVGRKALIADTATDIAHVIWNSGWN